MKKTIISASILSADFAKLGKEIKDVLAAGVDQIHFDVMDHHFVPNLSFGPIVCKALRKAGIKAPVDVHLMVEHPEQYIKSFAQAGATLIAFHPETTNDVEGTLNKIRDEDMQTGLAFNPENGLNVDEEILYSLDLILLMSVNPGFSGQAFLDGCLTKTAYVRKLLNKIGCQALLGVDGGIKTSNIKDIAKAGADFFVVGSGLFHANNYKECIAKLRREINACDIND